MQLIFKYILLQRNYHTSLIDYDNHAVASLYHTSKNILYELMVLIVDIYRNNVIFRFIFTKLHIYQWFCLHFQCEFLYLANNQMPFLRNNQSY